MGLILSVDPGEKHIGFCMFKYMAESKKADLQAMAVLDGPQELFSLFATAEGLGGQIETVVCENFRTRPPENNTNPRGRSPYGRSQSGAVISTRDFWSEQLTIRVIGVCEYFAFRVGAKFVTQEPQILAMGRKWCDFKVPQSPGSHIKDDISAYIHGAHYMMQRRMILGVEDILKFGQERIG